MCFSCFITRTHEIIFILKLFHHEESKYVIFQSGNHALRNFLCLPWTCHYIIVYSVCLHILFGLRVKKQFNSLGFPYWVYFNTASLPRNFLYTIHDATRECNVGNKLKDNYHQWLVEKIFSSAQHKSLIPLEL